MLPEMVVTPFTIDCSLLRLLAIVCGVCAYRDGHEQAMNYPPEMEGEVVDAPGLQHWVDVGHDPDAKPSWYPIWGLSPHSTVVDDEGVHRTFRSGKMLQPDGTYRTPFTE